VNDMRLIDADALWEELFATAKEGDVIDRIPPAMLDAQPTIDAVRVCRCKDCKHGCVFSLKKRLVDCPYHDDHMVDFDHFCSYGERRGDG
jgi:hypothetical protein